MQIYSYVDVWWQCMCCRKTRWYFQMKERSIILVKWEHTLSIGNMSALNTRLPAVSTPWSFFVLVKAPLHVVVVVVLYLWYCWYCGEIVLHLDETLSENIRFIKWRCSSIVRIDSWIACCASPSVAYRSSLTSRESSNSIDIRPRVSVNVGTERL